MTTVLIPNLQRCTVARTPCFATTSLENLRPYPENYENTPEELSCPVLPSANFAEGLELLREGRMHMHHTVALLHIEPLGAIICGENIQNRSAISRYFSCHILTQVVQYLARPR
jgi:hypothetical protein